MSSLVLLVGVVDARAGRIEEAIDFVVDGCLQQVRVDQHGEHAQSFVVFDEAHAAHVGGEVVDIADAAARFLAFVAEIEIGLDVLDVVEHLVPLVERFDVDAANPLDALLAQLRDQMSANEPAAACYENNLILHRDRAFDCWGELSCRQGAC